MDITTKEIDAFLMARAALFLKRHSKAIGFSYITTFILLVVVCIQFDMALGRTASAIVAIVITACITVVTMEVFVNNTVRKGGPKELEGFRRFCMNASLWVLIVSIILALIQWPFLLSINAVTVSYIILMYITSAKRVPTEPSS